MIKLRHFATIASLALSTLLTTMPAGASGEVIPTVNRAIATNTSLTVSWKVPPYGVAISGGWQVSATALDGSNTTTDWIGLRPYERHFTFAGLASGTSYRINVDELVGNRRISGVPTTSFGIVNALEFTQVDHTTGPKTTLSGMRIQSLTPSASSVHVSWLAPHNSATNPVRYYQISATPATKGINSGTQWFNLPPNTRSYTLNGLSSSTAYVFYYNTVYRNGYLRTQSTRAFSTL